MTERKPSLWSRLRAWCWGLLAVVIPDTWLRGIVRRKLRAFEAKVGDVLTDKGVELLLLGMELAFIFWDSYRKNLDGFRAQYVLRTADGGVAASAVFEPGRMWVKTVALPSPTVTVTFKDATAFRRFLSSKDHDIVQSLLANEVEVDGNLNQVYKLGYMARVLLSKFGLA